MQTLRKDKPYRCLCGGSLALEACPNHYTREETQVELWKTIFRTTAQWFSGSSRVYVTATKRDQQKENMSPHGRLANLEKSKGVERHWSIS